MTNTGLSLQISACCILVVGTFSGNDWIFALALVTFVVTMIIVFAGQSRALKAKIDRHFPPCGDPG